MQRVRNLGLVAALLLVVATAPAATHFSDVPASHWAYKAIQRAVDAGILQGYDGKFDGSRTLNRYQMAVVVSKLLDGVARREGAVPGAIGQDIDKLMDEFSTELSMFESRLTKVEEKVAAITMDDGKMKLSGCQVVCDDRCQVVCSPLEQVEKKATTTIASRKGKDLKIGGIVKTWWDKQDVADADEFDLRNARLLFLGTISKDIKWVLQSDGAHDNAPAAPSIIDLKLMINLDQKNPFKTYLQIGRFIPNFMRYQPVLIDTMDFVHYPVLTTQLAVFRQSGMEIYGKNTQGTMAWTFGILNGSDLNDNGWTGDISTAGAGENDEKDYYIRVDVKPKNSKFSGAIYHWAGSWGVDDRDRDRTGAFIEYKGECVRALVEYVTASNGQGVGLADIDMDGYYGQVIYHKKGSRLEYLVRYDDFDPNDVVDGDDIEWLTLGINWFLEGRECFFSLNHIDKETGAVDDKELAAQFTFIF